MKSDILTFEEALAQLQYWRELLVSATGTGNRDAMFEAAGHVGKLGALVREMRAQRWQSESQGSDRRENSVIGVDRRVAARSEGVDRRS
jgi:hypothetical protein